MLLVTDEDDERPVRSERSTDARVYLVLCTAGLGSCFFTALELALDSDLLTDFVAIASERLLEVSLEDLAFLSAADCCALAVVVVVVEVVR